MGLANVKLKLTPGGSPESVVINGTDLSRNVARVLVDADAKERIPVVTLILLGEVEIEGEGIVQLQPPTADIDPDEILAALVASLDPGELEARALTRMDGLGGVSSTGEAFVEALKELAGVGDGD